MPVRFRNLDPRCLACTWLCGRCWHPLSRRCLQRPQVSRRQAAGQAGPHYVMSFGTHARGTVLPESVFARTWLSRRGTLGHLRSWLRTGSSAAGQGLAQERDALVVVAVLEVAVAGSFHGAR
jgi:hypothetical protein